MGFCPDCSRGLRVFKINCPFCGRDMGNLIDVDAGRKGCVCVYCGVKLYKDIKP